MSLIDILKIIASKVQKYYGEKSLNELIAQGIAIYLEVMDALPQSRSLNMPTVDHAIVVDVLDEIVRRDMQE